MLPRWMSSYTEKGVNRIARRLAGHGPYVLLEHVGRKTGTVRRTPLRGYSRDGVLVIGLNHGNGSQWARNVMAAGKARFRYRGAWRGCRNPRLVPFDQVAAVIPPLPRQVYERIIHTEQALVLTLDEPDAAAA